MRLAVSLLLALPLFGQITIDCGSAADKYYSGGVAWSGLWEAPAPADSTVRYGQSFSYHVPVPAGNYSVKLTFIESTVKAPGLRLFSASVNGASTGTLDLYALAGFQVPYSRTLTAAAGSGVLDITLNATVKNAVISAVEITPVPAQGSSQAIRAGMGIVTTQVEGSSILTVAVEGATVMHLTRFADSPPELGGDCNDAGGIVISGGWLYACDGILPLSVGPQPWGKWKRARLGLE